MITGQPAAYAETDKKLVRTLFVRGVENRGAIRPRQRCPRREFSLSEVAATNFYRLRIVLIAATSLFAEVEITPRRYNAAFSKVPKSAPSNGLQFLYMYLMSSLLFEACRIGGNRDAHRHDFAVATFYDLGLEAVSFSSPYRGGYLPTHHK